MHVPFSMSDEPDLGDEFRGYSRDDDTQDDHWDSVAHIPQKTYTQAQMDAVIQHNLRVIAELREEIQNAWDEGYGAGVNTASGCC